jgi:hypothetical protein
LLGWYVRFMESGLEKGGNHTVSLLALSMS